VTSSLAVLEAESKPMYMITSCLKTRTKKKYGNKKYTYINIHLQDRSDIQFTAYSGELMPEEALTSFTVFDAYR